MLYRSLYGGWKRVKKRTQDQAVRGETHMEEEKGGGRRDTAVMMRWNWALGWVRECINLEFPGGFALRAAHGLGKHTLSSRASTRAVSGKTP